MGVFKDWVMLKKSDIFKEICWVYKVFSRFLKKRREEGIWKKMNPPYKEREA